MHISLSTHHGGFNYFEVRFREFTIRGFDYPRILFYVKNLVSAGFPSIIRGFLSILPQKARLFLQTVLPCYTRFWYSQDF